MGVAHSGNPWKRPSTYLLPSNGGAAAAPTTTTPPFESTCARCHNAAYSRRVSTIFVCPNHGGGLVHWASRGQAGPIGRSPRHRAHRGAAIESGRDEGERCAHTPDLIQSNAAILKQIRPRYSRIRHDLPPQCPWGAGHPLCQGYLAASRERHFRRGERSGRERFVGASSRVGLCCGLFHRLRAAPVSARLPQRRHSQRGVWRRAKASLHRLHRGGSHRWDPGCSRSLLDGGGKAAKGCPDSVLGRQANSSGNRHHDDPRCRC